MKTEQLNLVFAESPQGSGDPEPPDLWAGPKSRLHKARVKEFAGFMAQRVKDKRVLQLIGRMLKPQVVLPDGTRVMTEEGTPQGGPLSPLLSNRKRVMASVQRFLEKRLRLFINPEKSAVRRPQEVRFLGFRFCRNQAEQWTISVLLRDLGRKPLAQTSSDLHGPVKPTTNKNPRKH